MRAYEGNDIALVRRRNTRREMREIYRLNTAKSIPKDANLRDFFTNWHINRKWIPDHLRAPDGGYIYCKARI